MQKSRIDNIDGTPDAAYVHGKEKAEATASQADRCLYRRKGG